MTRILASLLLLTTSACSSAKYVIMKKGTYQIGKPVDQQPNAVRLQVVEATAPGGESFVAVLYLGSNSQVRSSGDSSALVHATAAVGRTAVKAAMRLAGVSERVETPQTDRLVRGPTQPEVGVR